MRRVTDTKRKLTVEYTNAIGMPVTVTKKYTDVEICALMERADVRILKK